MTYNPDWNRLNEIFEGESKVQVVDTGNGIMSIIIDSATVGSFDADGFQLASGFKMNDVSNNSVTNSTTSLLTAAAIHELSSQSIAAGVDQHVVRYDGTDKVESSNVIIDDSGNITGVNDLTVNNDLSVTGDLFIDGTTFVVNNQEVTTSDNLIVINHGEVGPGVTAGTAGLEVDRGSATNYQFIFDEPTDTFRVGEVGSLQAVATREDAPTDTRVSWWNDSEKRFDTAGTTYAEIDTANSDIKLITNSVETLSLTDGVQSIGNTADTSIVITQASDNILFEAANVTEVTIDVNGLSLKAGASVNEFSIDGTLVGDSDDAVPTEQAVKTYVDTEITTLESKLDLINVKFVSSNSDASTGDVVLVDTTAGNVAINLLESSDGKIVVKKVSADTNTVTVSTAPGNIDGNANVVIDTAYQSYAFVSDGTDFYII